MILYEVADVSYNQSRKRFYTTPDEACKYLLSVLPDWDEPAIRIWEADYQGEQYLCYITNGELAVKMGGVPTLIPTINQLKRHVTAAINVRKKNEG